MSIQNLKVFLVGGAVRDELLGLPVYEKDWVVIGSSVSEMLKLGFKQVGKDFPVFLHPINNEEYALARTERKTAKGYYGFKCDFSPEVTLEQDLSRRDLTINAMAKDLNGNLIDPFNGRLDLTNRILRHVSPAFVEDPVRVLRIARFIAQLGEYKFHVAAGTIEFIRTIINSHELEEVTPERIWKEIEKTLNTEHPDKFFEFLREVGALEIIFPELNKLFGIPQNKFWHPEKDVWEHTMLALKQAVKFTTDPKVRFAALCHDLGKGNTPVTILPKHHGHEARGVNLIKNWCSHYKVPNSYKNFAMQVARWHLHSHKAMELNPKTILKLFIGLDAFRNPKNLEDFLIACKADATGRKGKQQQPYGSEKFLKDIYSKIKSVDPYQFIQQGITGKRLGENIRKYQLNLIKQLKNDL